MITITRVPDGQALISLEPFDPALLPQGADDLDPTNPPGMNAPYRIGKIILIAPETNYRSDQHGNLVEFRDPPKYNVGDRVLITGRIVRFDDDGGARLTANGHQNTIIVAVEYIRGVITP